MEGRMRTNRAITMASAALIVLQACSGFSLLITEKAEAIDLAPSLTLTVTWNFFAYGMTLPCVGAYVELIDDENNTVSTSVTDAAGLSTFTNLNPGEYRALIFAENKDIVKVLNDSQVAYDPIDGNSIRNLSSRLTYLDAYNWTTEVIQLTSDLKVHRLIESGVDVWLYYNAVINAHSWFMDTLAWNQPLVYLSYPNSKYVMDPLHRLLLPHQPFSQGWVLHEYSHFVMYELYGGRQPDLGDYISVHNEYTESNGGQALSEGFAEFCTQVLYNFSMNNPLKGYYDVQHPGPISDVEEIIYADGASYDGDYGDWDGNAVEGAVLNLFWDIYDGTNSSDYPSWDQYKYGDYVDNQLPYLWTILATYRPNTMDEIWQHWEPKSTDLWAIFYHARMPSGERPTAPTSLVAYIVEGNASLRWKVPENNGTSDITGYNVYRGTDPTSLALYASVEGTAYVDTEIQAGITYHYRVSAVNSAGEGVNSSIVSTHYAIKPSAPTNLTSSGGNGFITLTWEAPTDDGGSSMISYSIYRGTSVESLSLLASTTDLTFTDLSVFDGVLYYYEVTAVNEAGASDRSDVASSSAISEASAPSVPQTVKAKLTNGSVLLTWKAPVTDGGSSLTNYVIYRGASDNPMASIARTTDHQFVDATTVEGETYYYSVAAVNSVGEGVKSSAVSVTVPASSVTQTSTPFLETIEGQVAIAGLFIAGVGLVAFVWLKRRSAP